MFKKIFVFLLVCFIAFYPVLVPLANASTKGDVEIPSPLAGEGKGEGDMDKDAKIRVQQTFGKLPLYFIQNNGQTDEKVKFYEKGGGHTTYFTKEGVYLSLVKNQRSEVKNEIASGIKPFAMTPLPNPRLQTPDSRLQTNNL